MIVGAALLAAPISGRATPPDADATTALSGELKALRAPDAPNRLLRVAAAVKQIEASPLATEDRARLMVGTGFLAKDLGAPGLRLAFEALDQGRALAVEARN